MIKNTSERLEVHKSKETSSAFFDAVIFCTNVKYANGLTNGGRSFSLLSNGDPLIALPGVDYTSRLIPAVDTDRVKVQSELAAAWLSLIPKFSKDNVRVLPSIEHAIKAVRGINSEGNEGVDILVTGSLLLVGGVIEVAGLSDVAL